MGRAQPKRRSNRRQTGASRGLPGWAMLTIGLIIGLFVAFLVYLEDLDPETAGSTEERQTQDGQATDGTDTATDTGDGEDAPPRFEFYSILPELEVVVPDGGEEAAEEAADDAETSGEGDAAPAPAPESDGRFYLQAGSFQKSAQADRMKARIALLGLDVDIQQVEINGENWHRVRVGPFTDPARLKDAQERLRKDGIDYLVTRDKSSG